MRTYIEYGVYYYRHNKTYVSKNEATAYQEVAKLLKLKVPAEVRCRRVTIGAWIEPKTRSFGYFSRNGAADSKGE